jgi:hypothetical protein
MARLQSQISWLKDGDANTQVFHLHARYKKENKFITKLVSGDQICTSQQEKAAIIDEFYDNLLGCCPARAYNLDELGIPEHNLS